MLIKVFEINVTYIKVTPNLCRCPPGKNSYVRHFQGNTANYISLESLTNVDFGKKCELPVSLIPQKKSQTIAKMTMCHSIELIGYQIQAQHFSIF